jgi:peptide/nickel transport system substrate-binding protein
MWQLDEAWHFCNFSPEALAEKGNADLLDPEDYYVPDFEKRIDEIYQLEKVTLDEDKVKDLFTEMNNLIAKHQPLIYTFAQNILIAKSNDLHLMIDEPKPYVGTLWRIWGVWKEQ